MKTMFQNSMVACAAVALSYIGAQTLSNGVESSLASRVLATVAKAQAEADAANVRASASLAPLVEGVASPSQAKK